MSNSLTLNLPHARAGYSYRWSGHFHEMQSTRVTCVAFRCIARVCVLVGNSWMMSTRCHFAAIHVVFRQNRVRIFNTMCVLAPPVVRQKILRLKAAFRVVDFCRLIFCGKPSTMLHVAAVLQVAVRGPWNLMSVVSCVRYQDTAVRTVVHLLLLISFKHDSPD